MVKLYEVPYERYSPKHKQSFSWPVILTNIISTISQVNHDLHMADPSKNESKINEGKTIIGKLGELKYEMGHNAVLSPIENDGGVNIDCYNDELATFAEDDKKWFTMNWLFAECYLYRRIRTYFANSTLWIDFDPFFESKAETYRSSSGAIIHLSKAVNHMLEQPDLQNGYDAPGSPLEVAFLEMIQADLWGNATDLSLLVDLKYEDLQKLQAVGAKAQEEQSKFILRNDLPKVWNTLKGMKNGRVDFVLDNARKLSHGVLPHPTVEYSPEAESRFVSDVVPFDFEWAIDSLLDTSFFASHASTPLTESDLSNLSTFANRLKSNLSTGKFRLSVDPSSKLGYDDFWTKQYAYHDMPAVAPELVEELSKSGLVIFKGDLNYRKLIGDATWPTTTPFDTALGPLAGRITLVSLRTNKADTIAGLDEGIEQELDEKAPDWRVSGNINNAFFADLRYAVVSFSPRRQ